MSEKRKTWRDRKCGCGVRVETRMTLDAATCSKTECWDRVFKSLGYVPSKELLARRASKR